MTERTKKKWTDRSKFEKIMTIARLVVSLVILLAAIMKYLNFWPDALNLAIPSFAVYYLLETIYNWKTDRDLAAFSLFMTVIIAAVSFIVFFL